MEDECLFPGAVGVVFFVAGDVALAVLFGEVIVVPKGCAEAVADIVAGGALVCEIVVRVAVALLVAFGRDDYDYIRLRFLIVTVVCVVAVLRGSLHIGILRCALHVSVCAGEVGEGSLDGPVDGVVQIVDGIRLLPSASDDRTVANLFADHDKGAAHGHDACTQLDFGGAFDRRVSRLAHGGAHDGLDHVRGVRCKFRSAWGENLDVGGKRKCGEREKSGENLFHISNIQKREGRAHLKIANFLLSFLSMDPVVYPL